ncbi:actin cytoplasmic type 5 [Plakobranchus ocellatus]|uniref:Actin cytoplasmic type 5 n=1 Tax=Plakobranchus ocellatus TaxID=259542 RepID=A0AAV4CXL2_9GAST|nr:actin cytoplasmic type 5 [Plakobranchus ocellatus]
MAPSAAGILTCAIILVFFGPCTCQQPALPIPVYYRGDWFSMEGGRSVRTLVSEREWGDKYAVRDIVMHPEFTKDGRNATMLMQKTDLGNCYVCTDVLWRTPNILQYKMSGCLTQRSDIKDMCPGVNDLPSQDQLITLFRQTLVTVNCISTWEGVYQFSYEVNWGGGGICDNQNSLLKACQDPGSSYQDNHIFFMTYARCPSVQSSRSENVRYQCMGSWFAVIGGKGYTFAAIADTVEKDTREKFKCLITLKNQKQADNSIRWGMSRFADCSNLNTLYDSPLRLVLRRVPPQTAYINPQCNLPRNVSGEWFTQGIQFKSRVVVNDTHIHYFTRKSEFEYEETYLSCQQTLGTRYLMTKYIVGKCEVDFVCYDILPRHHGIVRYRVGKPSHLTEDEIADPKFMTKKFREACSWQSFTFNRNDTDWKYEVLILDPPSPVVCPIGGRYSFQQNGNGELEMYRTRIRGVTIRPRTQINCRVTVSEFKSCSQDRSKIEVDEEYCETVDYRGRPIGEYEEPDHVLTCVGFWMEDMRSYLITYDEEDAISKFRCWVYERISWTQMSLSRSQTARCRRQQNSRSYLIEGTGLNLILDENERLFDDCPQRFDPGLNPYMKPMVIYVLSGTNHVTASQVVALLNSLIVIFISYIWL